MEKKLSKSNYFFIGSMLFGLFFGAGNLIFPVHMGQEAGYKIWIACIGFITTGTGLTFLGIVAMGLSGQKNLFDLAGLVSKRWSYFFTILLYLTIGPFFALPRTGTVSYTIGFSNIMPKEYSSLALFIFTLVFFGMALVFSLYPSKILLWVGKIFNPLFLVIISLLILFAIFNPMSDISTLIPNENYMTGTFFKGFTEGYNTMDAIASLAFGVIVVDTLRDLGVKEDKEIVISLAKAGFVSLILMVIIYAGLSFVGAQSGGLFGISENGGIALAQIIQHYFGALGSIVLAIIVFLACIKTAIGLISSCSDIFVEMFPRSLSYKAYACIFTFVSIIVANMGLSSIISFSIPVLMFIYPLVIVTIFLSMFTRKFDNSRLVWKSAVTVTAIFSIGDMLNALPDEIKESKVIMPVLNIYKKSPLFDIGMSWLIPVIITVAITLLIHFSKKKAIDKE